jgi:hypothetical protein
MKIVVLVAAALGGALATIAVPPTLIAASHEFRQVRLSDLNPFRAIFDSGRQRNRAGMTSEEQGVHAPAIGSKLGTLVPPASLKLDLGRAFEAQAQTQIQQNNRRMGDMPVYANNPLTWFSSPPN